MKPLNEKEFSLLKDFLKEYSDRLSNDGCNDWYFPKDWTQKEVNDFVGFFTYANSKDGKGDGEDYSHWAERRLMPDFCVISVLLYIMEKGSYKKD